MDTLERLRENGISFDPGRLADIARRYSVVELAVFGSSLRSDMRSDSDVDILVSFNVDARISLFDIIDLEHELHGLFGRPVDLVERESLTNPVRRQAILSSIEPLYAA